MKLRLNILTLAFLTCFVSKAQFEGLGSLFTDPLFRDLAKARHVRTMEEVDSRPTYTVYGGRYTMDTAGRVIAMLNSSGHLVRREYNAKSLIAKSLFYDEKDTSKIAYWVRMEYDEKGRLIKEETGIYQDGKLVVKKNLDSRVITGKEGKKRTETCHYYHDKVTRTTYSSDSVAGIYEFSISYEYRRATPDEKGRQMGEKMLTRNYYKDNCHYTDKVNYIINGRRQVPMKIETSYHQTDAKGRVLEYGTIGYEEAVSAYFQEHPEDFNRYSMPPLFIKEILNNRIKGDRKADVKYVYDSKGLLIEKNSYGTHYKFKYNNKDQVVEQTGQGSYNTIDLLYYNEKGLVGKMISKRSNPNDASGKIETYEAAFNYTYF
jgi:hypothetical protein